MDEKLLALGNNVIQQFDAIFGEHPGFRPAHAKGGPGLGAPYS
jgi:catalase